MSPQSSDCLTFIHNLKPSDPSIFFRTPHRKGWIPLFWEIHRLIKDRGFTLPEIFENELDLHDKEYQDSFLNLKEQRHYLKLLNPKKYFSLARNKYLTHILLDSLGIEDKSHLYLYYNPQLEGSTEKHTANNLHGVINLLRIQNVRCCVIKTTEDSHGENVRVIKDIQDIDSDMILTMHNENKIKLSDLLGDEPLIFEDVIQQSQQMSLLNASSVNTVRFMTVLYPDNKARVIACFMKIGRAGSCVDNAGNGGNVDSGVNLETGQLYNAICFNGWRKSERITNHPDSGVQVDGIVIKNWHDIKRKVCKYQEKLPFIKAAGWDIAITENGPKIIEVNDMWDRTGQIFIGRGWRKEIRDCYNAWINYYKK
jgi:hypothetical protein